MHRITKNITPELLLMQSTVQGTNYLSISELGNNIFISGDISRKNMNKQVIQKIQKRFKSSLTITVLCSMMSSQ